MNHIEIFCNVYTFLETVQRIKNESPASKKNELNSGKSSAYGQIISKSSGLIEKERNFHLLEIIKNCELVKKDLKNGSIEFEYLEDFQRQLKNLIPKSTIKKVNNNSIFKNENKEYLFDFFVSMLDYLKALDNNKKAKRTFQAKANGIYSSELIRKNLFRQDVSLMDYIKFLNENFDAKIKNLDKLSDGKNHINNAEIFFKDIFYSN